MLLRVQADNEGRDVHHLLADPGGRGGWQVKGEQDPTPDKTPLSSLVPQADRFGIYSCTHTAKLAGPPDPMASGSI